MESLAARRDVLPLTFSVDYWDYLGWTDTLARPEFVPRVADQPSRPGARRAKDQSLNPSDGRGQRKGAQGRGGGLDGAL